MSRLSSEVSNARSVGSLTQPRSKSTLIIAALAAMVVILGIGIVFALSSGESKSDATRSPIATDPPVTSTQSVSQPAVAPLPPLPVETRPAPLPPVVDPPAAMTVTKQPAPTPAPVVRRLPPRSPAPPPVVRAVVTAKAPAKAPTSSPPPEQAPPATDCNPPYYFEGSKKVFKPNCI